MKPALFKWMLHTAGMAITMLFAVIAYTFIFRPMARETSEVRATVQAKSDFLAGADEIAARNVELKGSLAETERLIDNIKRRIPDAPREADLLAQLADAAANSQVEIVDYRPATPVEKESHCELTIQVSATGRYAGICRFLDRLQSLPRLCHIIRMEIDASNLSSNDYPIELTLQVFYSRTQTVMAPVRDGDNG